MRSRGITPLVSDLKRFFPEIGAEVACLLTSAGRDKS